MFVIAAFVGRRSTETKEFLSSQAESPCAPSDVGDRSADRAAASPACRGNKVPEQKNPVQAGRTARVDDGPGARASPVAPRCLPCGSHGVEIMLGRRGVRADSPPRCMASFPPAEIFLRVIGRECMGGGRPRWASGFLPSGEKAAEEKKARVVGFRVSFGSCRRRGCVRGPRGGDGQVDSRWND